jgi:hypothetical protein
MMIMLRITPVAMFISIMNLPLNLFAQSVSENPGGFSLSEPMMIVAAILIALKVSLIVMLIHNKRRLKRIE